MTKFELKELESLKGGKVELFELVINDKSGLEEFIEKYKGFKKELNQLNSRLLVLANGEERKLPPSKYKELKRDKKDPYKDYELKTDHLRLYLFKDSGTGKIIVLGGMKKTQKKDICKLRKIKKDYFNQK